MPNIYLTKPTLRVVDNALADLKQDNLGNGDLAGCVQVLLDNKRRYYGNVVRITTPDLAKLAESLLALVGHQALSPNNHGAQNETS